MRNDWYEPLKYYDYFIEREDSASDRRAPDDEDVEG